MNRKPVSRLELAGYLICPSLFVMLTLMVVEAGLAATTTWLVINAGKQGRQRPVPAHATWSGF